MGFLKKLRKKIKKAHKKVFKKIGKGVKNAGKWVGKNKGKILKVVGTVAKVVGAVAQVIPVVGQVAGGALLVAGTAAAKAAKKLEPILNKVKKVKTVLGESRINKMVQAVDKKGFVNTESIKNTLKAKGIIPNDAIVDDVKDVLQKVVEVKKEAEQDYDTGVESAEVKVPSMAAPTKSRVTTPKVSEQQALSNQSKADAVYNQKSGKIVESIKEKFGQLKNWLNEDKKRYAFVLAPVALIIGAVFYMKNKGGSRKRRR